MRRTNLLTMVVAAACAVAAMGPAVAADQQREQVQSEARERIYGSDLMSEQERHAYQVRMRELKTQQEREQFRKEHHERMKERARERGVTLPDDPPSQGRGMGPRYGEVPGAGKGPGGAPGGGGKGR